MRAKFYRPRPLSGDYVLPHPLNIEIYRLIFDNILSSCLCHTSICAIELDSWTMLQNQVNQDIRPNSGTVPAKPGHLVTVIALLWSVDEAIALSVARMAPNV